MRIISRPHDRVMLIVRRTFAILLAFAGLYSSMMMLASGGWGIGRMISENRKLDAQFRLAAGDIEMFKQLNGRLPTQAEFNLGRVPNHDHSYALQMSEGGFSSCDRHQTAFATLHAPDYVLLSWRNEWMECYAPTKGLTTLALKPAEFTTLGSFARDQLAYLAAAVVSFALAIAFWRRWGRERESW